MDTFFWNGHGFPGLASGSLDTTVDFYYSVLVPWFQIHYRDVETYKRDGDRTMIGLKGNSTIGLDWKANTYSVSVNGVEVAKDGDTFCPLGNDRIAFYAKEDKQLSATLPAGWKPGSVVARALTVDKAEDVRHGQGREGNGVRVRPAPGDAVPRPGRDAGYLRTQ